MSKERDVYRERAEMVRSLCSIASATNGNVVWYIDPQTGSQWPVVAIDFN